ncbi:MAG TPA: Nif3-like dinuclear metal center hexameric protein [Gammaproteobacteria bacterium]|nr:Nif3-like dinuclear metal center hexameric protein [Gammaproteobacteria bacterium]
MVALHELVGYTDRLLAADEFADYSPNGLQVEGRPQVRKLVSGVTASLALIEAAIAAGADALLVHHGYFWKGEDQRVVGMKRARLAKLLAADVSLLAYHLPLDAHPDYGNNVQLAKMLDFAVQGRFGAGGRGPELALWGALQSPLSATGLGEHLAARLGRPPLHVAGGPSTIRTLGWCTGAAQSFIEAAASNGLDAFISGEISEPTVHVARECGIHFFAAGHHATERYGARALGAHLGAHFGLEHAFIDIDSPA